MNKGHLAIAFSLLISGNAVSAGILDFNTVKPNIFNYNYIEGGYLSRDGDYDGFGFSGSYDIKPNLSLIGSFSNTSADFAGFSSDFTALSFGAAHHYRFDNQTISNLDLSFHAEYVSYEWDASGFFGTKVSFDDSGFRLGVKGRHQMSQELEISGDVSFETTDGADLILTPGFAYKLKENISIIGTYELSDWDVLTIGARLYF